MFKIFHPKTIQNYSYTYSNTDSSHRNLIFWKLVVCDIALLNYGRNIFNVECNLLALKRCLHLSQINIKQNTLHSDRSKGAPGTSWSKFYHFMQFSAAILQNNRLAHPPLGVGVALLGNPGSVTAVHIAIFIVTSSKFP